MELICWCADSPPDVTNDSQIQLRNQIVFTGTMTYILLVVHVAKKKKIIKTKKKHVVSHELVAKTVFSFRRTDLMDWRTKDRSEPTDIPGICVLQTSSGMVESNFLFSKLYKLCLDLVVNYCTRYLTVTVEVFYSIYPLDGTVKTYSPFTMSLYVSAASFLCAISQI